MNTNGAPSRGMTADEVESVLGLEGHPKMLTVTQASEITSLSRDSLLRAIRDGELPAMRASTDPRAHYRIARDHLRDYVVRMSQRA